MSSLTTIENEAFNYDHTLSRASTGECQRIADIIIIVVVVIVNSIVFLSSIDIPYTQN